MAEDAAAEDVEESTTAVATNNREDPEPVVRGVINDISVFERGDRGKEGVCVVVALGKEHRLGRWEKVAGKNGAMVFEVARHGKL
jgi:ribosomal RNA-processing protein 9